jgi:two-component system sensor histidine kinase SenX3
MKRRQAWIVVSIVLCVVLVAAAIGLNVGWILVNSRRMLPLALGILAFALIIAGLIVYTVFLVREMWRAERHDGFINAVTHELKTPIASIRLYLDTLMARDLSDGQRREFYGIMLADTERLQRTVEQVLKAGVAGQRPRAHATRRAPVDMTAIARECVEVARVRHHLSAEALALSATDVAPAAAAAAAPGAAPAVTASPFVVAGDADDLRTALSNLLDNAVKYSLEQIQVAVELTASAPETVRICVRDRGVGIPRSQLRRIFRRFYRVQARGFNVKGTGLGLYIVQSIARQHGGRVFADSDGEGKGATFTLELPRLARG